MEAHDPFESTRNPFMVAVLRKLDVQDNFFSLIKGSAKCTSMGVWLK
jgi:hypothetical protein